MIRTILSLLAVLTFLAAATPGTANEPATRKKIEPPKEKYYIYGGGCSRSIRLQGTYETLADAFAAAEKFRTGGVVKPGAAICAAKDSRRHRLGSSLPSLEGASPFHLAPMPFRCQLKGVAFGPDPPPRQVAIPSVVSAQSGSSGCIEPRFTAGTIRGRKRPGPSVGR